MDKSTTHHSTGDQALVRKLNTAIILDSLRLNAPLSRAEISTRTRLNRSTVSSIVTGLIRDGLVREIEFQKDKLGRPGMLMELSPDGACAIGVEIGVDFISIMLADFVAKPIWRSRVAIDPAIGQAAHIKRAGDLIQEALTRAAKAGLRPLGIGVGVPGMVDVPKGDLVYAPNLTWHHVQLRQLLMKRFKMPVFIENDANAAALGEYYFGVAREAKNFIYLSVGVGLGGGIVLGGKLFRGMNGYAGEIGHMALDPNGSLCGCGRRGCWESLVSPRALVQSVQTVLQNGSESLIRELAGNDLNNITLDQIIQAALADDCVALDALKDVSRWLGVGIANLVNIFNPELVVLGGALTRAKSIVIPVIEATVRESALGQPRETLRIAISAHQSEACIVGAAAIVLDDILRYPFP